MGLNSVGNPQNRTDQTTRNTTVLPTPTNTHAVQLFNNARNNHFNNSTFVTNDRPLLEVLYACVAPNAILNSGGRADPIRCHPGTRKEVIDRINKWREDAQSGVAANRIFWLSGPAGAGKTAIVQTIAESWASHGVHTANFFFFRTDASRSHAKSLVSTLLYQIFDIYPSMRDTVENLLALKPRILDASIRDQFNQLICSPLRTVGAPFPQPIILLIDGLDECDSEEKTSQAQILHALDMLVSQDDLPFLVLVGSRDEHQITTAFKDLRSTIDSIFLNEEYAPTKDIHVFVTAEFDRIKRTHRLAPKDGVWPSSSDITSIVARSSGQFVYAATVMRFILHSASDPKLSLARIRGVTPIATKSPFSHLDAMYTYILSQVEDQEALKDILCAYLLAEKWLYGIYTVIPKFQSILSFYNDRYTPSVIHSCIADLTTLARIKHKRLHFYHTSFGDYLQTESRSGRYYSDADALLLKMSPKIFTHKAESGNIAVDYLRRVYLTDLLKSETMTPISWSALFSLNADFYLDLGLNGSYANFRQIYKGCVSYDDVTKYRQLLCQWVGNYMTQTYKIWGPLEKCLQGIPYGFRYLAMAQIDHAHGDINVQNSSQMDFLRSESAFDALETASWVQNLLRNIHGKYYPGDLKTYLRLIKQWIFWAIFNDIAVDSPDNLPYGQQFFDLGKAKRRAISLES